MGLVVIYSTNDIAQAERVRSVLETNGLMVILQSHERTVDHHPYSKRICCYELYIDGQQADYADRLIMCSSNGDSPDGGGLLKQIACNCICVPCFMAGFVSGILFPKKRRR